MFKNENYEDDNYTSPFMRVGKKIMHVEKIIIGIVILVVLIIMSIYIISNHNRQISNQSYLQNTNQGI